jgi:hypothetical protein
LFNNDFVNYRFDASTFFIEEQKDVVNSKFNCNNFRIGFYIFIFQYLKYVHSKNLQIRRSGIDEENHP